MSDIHKKISIMHVCKNREYNLLNSINSYIENDVVNDIVIIDFNSTNDLKTYILNNITQQYNHKITVVKVINEIQFIASIANNIGFLYCRNEIIFKLDADNIIVNHSTFFNKYLSYDLDNTFIYFDWTNAVDDNETHLNGIFFTTKTQLCTKGYHNMDLLFYGWDDCEIKNRLKKDKTEIKIENKEIIHQHHNDNTRIINQYNNDGINFFGFTIEHMITLMPLILYNSTRCDLFQKIFYKQDISDIVTEHVRDDKYVEITVNITNVKKNKSPFILYECNEITICEMEIFNTMVQKSNYLFWDNIPHCINYKNIITSYNLMDNDACLLFNLYYFEELFVSGNNNHRLVTIINDDNVKNNLNAVYYLKKNIRNGNIKHIHVLINKDCIAKEIIETFIEYNFCDFSNRLTLHLINKIVILPDFINSIRLQYNDAITLINNDIIFNEPTQND